jgi:two-component system cell cycle response regulator DivK
MQHVPIIAVTAQTDAIARRLALAFGCDGFIPKPIDTRTFPSQVATYLKEK